MRKRILALFMGALVLMTLCATAAASKSDEVKVSRVQVSSPTLTVRVNQTRMLFALVTPMDADDRSLVWTSSNEGVAMVDGDGIVTGISPGTATVTATAHNGKKGVCEVTVPSYVLQGVEQNITNDQFVGAALNGGELVTVEALKLQVEQAVRQMAEGQTATVTLQDKSQIAPEALRAAAWTAEYEGGRVRLVVDTMLEEPVDPFSGRRTVVQGRLIIDPHGADWREEVVYTAVYTEPERVRLAQEALQARYAGNYAVVQCGQQGSYGTEVRMAAQVNLSQLQTGHLRFFLFDRATGVLTELDGTNYAVEEGGYVHFTTSQGGTIVVTDGVLQPR